MVGNFASSINLQFIEGGYNQYPTKHIIRGGIKMRKNNLECFNDFRDFAQRRICSSNRC